MEGDEENEPVPAWSCNPDSERWTPCSASRFNRALEFTWALLQLYIHATYNSQNDTTLSYIEDAIHHCYTLDDVFLLQLASKISKVKATGLRMELVKKQNVDEET